MGPAPIQSIAAALQSQRGASGVSDARKTSLIAKGRSVSTAGARGPHLQKVAADRDLALLTAGRVLEKDAATSEEKEDT